MFGLDLEIVILSQYMLSILLIVEMHMMFFILFLCGYFYMFQIGNFDIVSILFVWPFLVCGCTYAIL